MVASFEGDNKDFLVLLEQFFEKVLNVKFCYKIPVDIAVEYEELSKKKAFQKMIKNFNILTPAYMSYNLDSAWNKSPKEKKEI